MVVDKARQWFVSAFAWVIVAMLAGGSMAGVGARLAAEDDGDGAAPAVETTEAGDGEEGGATTAAVEVRNTNDTHGACVSRWAREAKAAGLEGRARGEFVRSVAQSDCSGPEADFSAALAEAVAAQGASGGDDGTEGEGAEHGKGRSEDHGPPEGRGPGDHANEHAGEHGPGGGEDASQDE